MKTTNRNRIKINFHSSRSRNARPIRIANPLLFQRTQANSPRKKGPTDKAYPLPTYPIPQVNARFRLYNPSASLKPEGERGGKGKQKGESNIAKNKAKGRKGDS